MAWWIPLMMAAGGAVMGAKKNERDREIEDADRKLAAETARYSWITGMQPGSIRRAGSQFADVGQGALSGAMFGSQFGDWGTASVKPGDPSGGMSGEGNFSDQSWYKQLSEKPKPIYTGGATSGNPYSYWG